MNKLFITLATATLFLIACAPEPPESTLEEAGQELREALDKKEEAVDEVADAMDQLRDERAEVAAAEKELQRARKKLQERRKALAGEQQDLQAAATDTAIFRLLQKRLLEAPELNDLAISVNVFDGHVTLTGNVSKPTQNKVAQQIALGVPGVASVDNLLIVPPKASGNE